MMDLKYFFDFKKAWDEITNEYKEDDVFSDDMLDCIENERIRNFIKSPDLSLNIEECDLLGSDTGGIFITFCFSEEHQTANESNPQNETTVVFIEYFTDTNGFTNYQREQG